MISRRGRLNWSNLEVHISDRSIESQHRFHVPPAAAAVAPVVEEKVKEEAPVKRAWKPKKEVGELNLNHFVGNYMLTSSTDRSYSFVCSTVSLSLLDRYGKSRY